VLPMVQFPLVRWSVIVCSCDDIGTQTWAVRATQLVDTSPNTSGGPWQHANCHFLLSERRGLRAVVMMFP
jgi:hypothetical protein